MSNSSESRCFLLHFAGWIVLCLAGALGFRVLARRKNIFNCWHFLVSLDVLDHLRPCKGPISGIGSIHAKNALHQKRKLTQTARINATLGSTFLQPWVDLRNSFTAHCVSDDAEIRRKLWNLHTQWSQNLGIIFSSIPCWQQSHQCLTTTELMSWWSKSKGFRYDDLVKVTLWKLGQGPHHRTNTFRCQLQYDVSYAFWILVWSLQEKTSSHFKMPDWDCHDIME